ncbi:hypothetical protein HPB48_001938 [Haemaphysalis longicornis]|uniref:Tudor domain-containing protein n=1 Tax=Haemaphysalis longicornis TaxID=44386 RepID=A0A9J6G4B1_HAELO|nr:hypothetical protein HPB48_001938 [Haemaphysalis longicornis]
MPVEVMPAYILAHSLNAEGNGVDEVAMQRMRCCRFIDYRTTQEALAAIAGLHNKPPFYLKVNLSTMSLSERWKFDARKKEELEEIRRKIEERHGLPAYNVPSQPGAGRGFFPGPLAGVCLLMLWCLVFAGRGLLASYTAEDVEVGHKPGDRRVFSSPDGSGGRTGPPASHGSSSSAEESQVDERLRVMISDDGSGVQKREVWYTDDPMPFIQECLVCSSFCGVSPKTKGQGRGDRTGPQAGLPKKPQGPARSPIKPNKPSSQPRTPPAQPEPRPPASKPLLSSDKLEPATLPQGGPTEVTLCFGNDLSEFYLQCSSKAAELTQLQADLQALCASNRGFQPAVGEACAALFADDKQWYRATVTSAGPNCVVYFVDYGNTAPVAAENMCRIPDKCMRLPAQAIRCRLHGVRPLATTGAWTEEAFSELAGVLQEGPLVAKLLRRAEGFHEVELAAKAGGESLNQRLVSKGSGESVAPVAAPTAAPSVVPPRGPPAAQRMRSVLSLAQVGETLPLQVTVSAHEQVWTLAVLPEVAMALVKVEEALQAEGAQATSTGGHPPQGISCGSYVASQSSEDGRWYRAYVTRMAGQEVSLLSFAVESIEGTTVRGTVTSDADGKGLGTLALAAWDYGLPSEEPAAAAASPRAKSVAAPPATSPPQKASSPAAPPPTSRAAEAKLPATKCPMVPVWKTPDVLYLQQQGLAPELEAMMAALNAWVKAEQPRPSEVNYSKGDYVCALFSEDSKWYRGKVMGVRSPAGRYLVMFIDFGNSEELPSTYLRPLPPRFAETPLFAFCVIPQGVCPADPRLVALLEQEPFSAVQVDVAHGGLPVVRLERRDGTCLNTLAAGGQPKAAQAVAAGGSKQSPQPKQQPPCPAAAAPPPPAQQPLVTVDKCPLDTSAGGSFSGVVSAVEGNLVFVQPMDRCSTLLGITQALGDPAVRAAQGTLSGLPPVGQGVLALYSEDNMWYRARVVSVDGARSKARVAFVDYGNEEGRGCQGPAAHDGASWPRRASCCLPVVLDGVPLLAPRAVDLPAQGGAHGGARRQRQASPRPAARRRQVHQRSCRPEGRLSGEWPASRSRLFGACAPHCVARRRSLADSTTSPIRPVEPRVPKSETQGAPKQTFVERPLPSGRCKATISHIDSEGCCYVQQLSLAATLQSMMAELNSGVLTEPLPSPAPGHAAGARYAADGLWYRVRVLAAPEAGQCRVTFVDFGNDEVVPLSDMRVLPEKMKAVHLFANRVALHGVKSVGTEYAAHLLNVELELEVADAASQPCKVKLYVDDQCLNDLIE